MNLTVIGATGMVGSRLVTEAARRGHTVTAAARRSTASRSDRLVTPRSLDLGDPDQLDSAITGVAAVLLAVRPASGQESTLASLTADVLGATARAGARLLVIGGAGALRSPNDPALLVAEDRAFVPPAWRAIAAASAEQLRMCRAHPAAAWTYLSPPAVLEPGTRTGAYERGSSTLLVGPDGSSRISVEDLAVAAIDEIERPSGVRHFTVARSWRREGQLSTR